MMMIISTTQVLAQIVVDGHDTAPQTAIDEFNTFLQTNNTLSRRQNIPPEGTKEYYDYWYAQPSCGMSSPLPNTSLFWVGYDRCPVTPGTSSCLAQRVGSLTVANRIARNMGKTTLEGFSRIFWRNVSQRFAAATTGDVVVILGEFTYRPLVDSIGPVWASVEAKALYENTRNFETPAVNPVFRRLHWIA
ncbi:hypothetical protein HDV05_002980, partial [Chytridiales sp. JEL 0842]